mgnify:CR=1 FL=1
MQVDGGIRTGRDVVVDLSGLPEAEAPALALAGEEAARPFDLAHGRSIASITDYILAALETVRATGEPRAKVEMSYIGG